MNHFVISAALTSFFSLITSLCLWRLDPQKQVIRIASIYWFSIAFWAFFVGSQSYTINLLSPFWWGWFLHLGCTFIPVLLFHFSLVLTKNNKPTLSRMLTFSYAVTVLFNVLNISTGSFTFGTAYRDAYAYPRPAPLYPLYFFLFVLLVVISTVLMIKALPSLQPTQKKGLTLLLITQMLAYMGGMDNFLIMADVRIPPLYPYGLYLVLPYAFMTLYVAFRHQLVTDDFKR